MRPLPSLLLLCASYGVTAIVYDFSTGKNGLDYCIAEADTTSDMTASTTMLHGSSNVCATMVDNSCTLHVSHHLGAWRVRAQPQSSRRI